MPPGRSIKGNPPALVHQSGGLLLRPGGGFARGSEPGCAAERVDRRADRSAAKAFSQTVAPLNRPLLPSTGRPTLRPVHYLAPLRRLCHSPNKADIFRSESKNFAFCIEYDLFATAIRSCRINNSLNNFGIPVDTFFAFAYSPTMTMSQSDNDSDKVEKLDAHPSAGADSPVDLASASPGASPLEPNAFVSRSGSLIARPEVSNAVHPGESLDAHSTPYSWTPGAPVISPLNSAGGSATTQAASDQCHESAGASTTAKLRSLKTPPPPPTQFAMPKYKLSLHVLDLISKTIESKQYCKDPVYVWLKDDGTILTTIHLGPHPNHILITTLSRRDLRLGLTSTKYSDIHEKILFILDGKRPCCKPLKSSPQPKPTLF